MDPASIAGLQNAPPTQSAECATSSRQRRQQKKDALRRMRGLLDDVLPNLQTAATVAAGAASDAGVPGLGGGLTALAEVLKKIQTMKKTVDGVDTLHDRVAELSRIVTDFCSRERIHPLSEATSRRIEGLASKWQRIAERAEHITGRSRLKRFFTADSDTEKLKGLVQEISDSIQQDFLMQGLLNIEEGVQDIRRGVERVREDVGDVIQGIAAVQDDVAIVQEGVAAVREDVAEANTSITVGIAQIDEGVAKVNEGVAQVSEGVAQVKEGVQVVQARLDDSFMPTYAKGAQYDANNVRRGCLEGTRVDLLKALLEWILAACSRKGTTGARIVYWINGLAGTGKTTIAYSVAVWCREHGLLGASFFCSRFDIECSDPNSVFRTISRQLCHFFAPFKNKVVEILAKDSTLVHAGASRQFEELILRPLEELECDFPRCVIVIDALDECKDEDTISVILSIIAKFVPRIAPFLIFLLTSRPERRITHLFDSSEYGALKAATTPFLLHMVNLESVLDDIHRYLEKRLAEVRDYFKLTNWPNSLQLSRLAELSTGLFIWAATAVRFIEEDTVSDPEGQLQVLLSIQPAEQGTPESPGTILDPLYSQIVRAAFPTIAQALAQRLQSILGTIVLTQEPVSVTALEGLTGTKSGLIRATLHKLHSVLHIPDDDNEPIRVIHPTFAEFLLHPSLSKPEAVVISATAQHARLLLQTLDNMNHLKPNMANLPTPSTFRSEVPGVTNTVRERISAALSYSCRHWSAHLDLCNDAELIRPMLDLLNTFFHERLLNWLEACSLLGAVDGSIAALQVARKACRSFGEPFALLAEFIFDCLRFTQTYYACIDAAPLQVYHSLLVLAPVASLVKKQYAEEVSQSLLITRGAPPDWGLCIDTIVGHNRSMIISVSFSADGVFFATGGKDGYVRIWRTATRTSIKAIPAGDGDHRVAFSPVEAQVASAPNLRVWDVKTGDVVHTLEHEGANYVAYSADGTRLASGSNAEIKLWDPSSGTCLDTITSVRAEYTMAIGPDGIWVGESTPEGHPAIYNTISKAPKVLDEEKGGRVAAFSPDGHYVASRASDEVTVWQLEDRSATRTINASSHVYSIAFSHSGTQIGCGCNDGRIRIWTIASNDPPRVLAGHTRDVYALAWSPDDTQVISVSDDGTIRVWDLTRHRSDTTLAASPPSSLAPLPGAPCYAVLRTPFTTALFSLPAPIQPSTAASDAAEDAPIITLHADMADAWDAVLRGGGASGEFAASRDWAFLTGRLYANMNEDWPVAMTPDGSGFAHRFSRGVVKVHNNGTGDHPTLFLESRPEALTFAPGNSHLAAADYPTLKIWDVTSSSNSPIKEITLDSYSDAIAYSHNSGLLVAGMTNSDVHIYNTTTGQSVKYLRGTHGRVTQITFSADDRHVIAQAHPWLVIWDVETGNQILEFTSTHNNLLHSFDFAADDTGILIPDVKGGTTKVTLWSPGDRTWPVYAVTEDSWLYGKGPGKVRRLCWLPPEWRTIFSAGGPTFCALDFERRRTVVFDVSRVPEYVEAWGMESDARED